MSAMHPTPRPGKIELGAHLRPGDAARARSGFSPDRIFLPITEGGPVPASGRPHTPTPAPGKIEIGAHIGKAVGWRGRHGSLGKEARRAACATGIKTSR